MTQDFLQASLTITAEVEIPKGGANGVIISQAGRFGGWSLYLKDGETCVSDDYKEGTNAFTGKIQKVTIEVGPVKLAAADTDELEKTKLARKAGE